MIDAKKTTVKKEVQADYPTSLSVEVLKQLAKPFEKISWRPQRVIKSSKNNKHWGIMIAYINARDVIDRLNEVVGADWNFTWTPTPATNVVKGRLEIFNSYKEDVGYPNSDRDTYPYKSAVSDALKRCAVQYGVGRFLYNLENKFIEYDAYGKKPINQNDLKKLENIFKPIG